jgi:hypothetical protein
VIVIHIKMEFLKRVHKADMKIPNEGIGKIQRGLEWGC